MSFLEGYGWGLAMIVFVGPVVFTLLKNTLEKGKLAGFMVASGILTSDVIVILICLAGAIPFFEKIENQYWIALVGAVILLGMGIKYIFMPGAHDINAKRIKGKDIAASFSGGLLVNLINPFVFMVWIGFIVYGQSRFGDGRSLWLFLFGMLLGIYSQDLFKVFFAGKIKSILHPKKLKKIYKVIGILMLIFAIRLFVFAFNV